jgi:DNA-binding response OmpR family regulator
MLTVRADEDDVVHALRAGADDYIVKPPMRGVLLARIAAVLRRTQLVPGGDDSDLAPYGIDNERARILIDGRDTELTQREFELAVFLFRRHGRIIRRETLLESVWQIASSVPTRTVDTHISRLRRKLQLDGAFGWRLVAVYQHGYRLEKFVAGGERA